MGLGDLHGLFRVSLGIKHKTLQEITNMKLNLENILPRGANCYKGNRVQDRGLKHLEMNFNVTDKQDTEMRNPKSTDMRGSGGAGYRDKEPQIH